MKNINRKLHRDLDDQGKIYSLSRNYKDTSIFRLSATLNEKIEPRLLEQAVILALEKYKVYRVKMKAGLFGYHFEENKKNPIVKKAGVENFKQLNTPENNYYLFRITYERKAIHIEIFHPLTDANGGIIFFKEILKRYLELRHPKSVEKNIIEDEKTIVNSENAYTKNYKHQLKHSYNPPTGYMIKGERIPDYNIALNHFNMKLEDIKELSKEKNCTLSELLVAMLAYSIYRGNYQNSKDKKPINICIPVDLRKYFDTKTKSNFVSYIVISLKLKKHTNYSFDVILNKVVNEFNEKLRLIKLLETTTANGKVLNNPFVKVVPLAIKRALVILGTFGFKRKFSTTLSNIGEFKMEEQYQKYIEKFQFALSPDWSEKLRCGVVSYKQSIIMTFGTNITESNIEIKFKELLDCFKIKYTITNNGINKII